MILWCNYVFLEYGTLLKIAVLEKPYTEIPSKDLAANKNGGMEIYLVSWMKKNESTFD